MATYEPAGEPDSCVLFCNMYHCFSVKGTKTLSTPRLAQRFHPPLLSLSWSSFKPRTEVFQRPQVHFEHIRIDSSKSSFSENVEFNKNAKLEVINFVLMVYFGRGKEESSKYLYNSTIFTEVEISWQFDLQSQFKKKNSVCLSRNNHA